MNKLWERIKTNYKKPLTESQIQFPNHMKTLVFYLISFAIALGAINETPITIKPQGKTTGYVLLFAIIFLIGWDIYTFFKRKYKENKKKNEIEVTVKLVG